MKYSLIFLFILGSITGVVAQDKNYGATITKNNAVEIEKAIEDSNTESVKIKGEIITSCAKKGCWMTMKVNDNTEMRVTFKDYSFFVPTEGIEGKTAYLEGNLNKVVTDIETLKHFAEDAGKSEEEIAKITKPKEEYTFVATGVIIKE